MSYNKGYNSWRMFLQSNQIYKKTYDRVFERLENSISQKGQEARPS